MTIAQALAGLAIPVCHPPYTGDAPDYVTYQLLGQTAVLYADGMEQETVTSFVVNLYTTGRYTALLLAVKAALQAEGWIVVVDQEFYDDSVGKYRVVMTADREGAVYG